MYFYLMSSNFVFVSFLSKLFQFFLGRKSVTLKMVIVYQKIASDELLQIQLGKLALLCQNLFLRADALLFSRIYGGRDIFDTYLQCIETYVLKHLVESSIKLFKNPEKLLFFIIYKMYKKK